MLDVAEPKEQEERTLIARAVKRDREAFGLLYDSRVTRVSRHVYDMVGTRSEAEDTRARASRAALSS